MEKEGLFFYEETKNTRDFGRGMSWFLSVFNGGQFNRLSIYTLNLQAYLLFL